CGTSAARTVVYMTRCGAPLPQCPLGGVASGVGIRERASEMDGTSRREDSAMRRSPMERPDLIWEDEAVRSLCLRHGIRELFVFGSALGPDFKSDSDVDFLVRLEPEKRLRVRDLLAIEDDLAA